MIANPHELLMGGAWRAGDAAVTLRLSAEEARRFAGDVLPFDGAPGQAGRLAFTLRVPLGVIAAITPFKIAPAFAAGNSVILEPSSSTPVTACLLAQVLLDAGMPDGVLSVLHCNSNLVSHLLEDERVRLGGRSPRTWRKAPRRRAP